MNDVCLISFTVLASALAMSIICCFCLAKDNKEVKRNREELLESLPQRSIEYMKSEESSKTMYCSNDIIRNTYTIRFRNLGKL